MATNVKKQKKNSLLPTRQVTGALSYYKRPWVLNYREERPTVYKMQIVRANVIKDDAITAYAAKAANVPTSTIKMAKEALFDAINYFCGNGRTVQVPVLGTFAVRTRSKAKPTAEELDSEAIQSRHIIYYPKKDLAVLGRSDNIEFIENKTLSDLALASAPAVDEGDGN